MRPVWPNAPSTRPTISGPPAKPSVSVPPAGSGNGISPSSMPAAIPTANGSTSNSCRAAVRVAEDARGLVQLLAWRDETDVVSQLEHEIGVGDHVGVAAADAGDDGAIAGQVDVAEARSRQAVLGHDHPARVELGVVERDHLVLDHLADHFERGLHIFALAVQGDPVALLDLVVGVGGDQLALVVDASERDAMVQPVGQLAQGDAFDVFDQRRPLDQAAALGRVVTEQRRADQKRNEHAQRVGERVADHRRGTQLGEGVRRRSVPAGSRRSRPGRGWWWRHPRRRRRRRRRSARPARPSGWRRLRRGRRRRCRRC